MAQGDKRLWRERKYFVVTTCSSETRRQNMGTEWLQPKTARWQHPGQSWVLEEALEPVECQSLVSPGTSLVLCLVVVLPLYIWCWHISLHKLFPYPFSFQSYCYRCLGSGLKSIWLWLWVPEKSCYLISGWVCLKFIFEPHRKHTLPVPLLPCIYIFLKKGKVKQITQNTEGLLNAARV